MSSPVPAAPLQPPQPAVGGGSVLELLWFDVEAAAIVRGSGAWADLLGALEVAPGDPVLRRYSRAVYGSQSAELEELFEILARAEPASLFDLPKALAAAPDEGKLVLPLGLLAGRLTPSLDELRSLQVTADIARALCPGDEAMADAADTALALSGNEALRGLPNLAQAMAAVDEAFATAQQAPDAAALHAIADRVLLLEQAYERRELLGGEHLRALLSCQATTATAVVYLPAATATLLPLERDLDVRLLVEVHPPLDPFEQHPVALRALAVAQCAPHPTTWR